MFRKKNLVSPSKTSPARRPFEAVPLALVLISLLALPLICFEWAASVSAKASGASSHAAADSAKPAETDAATRARLSEAYGRLPLSFEANRGQADTRAGFVARGQGYALFLTSGEAVLKLRGNA